jgi:hypothetical protein
VKKTKLSKIESKPFHHNENIHVYYSLNFGKDEIGPGTPLKFKNQRGVFKFIKWVHNQDLDVQWIDCMDITTGEFKSFYMERLKNIVKKKSRRKK